jgi:CBS domain-containing protein
MQVENVLQSKGRTVITVAAGATIADAVDKLNTHRIGAVVVVDGERVIGILSERDIVRHLGRDWSGLASRPVSDLMTKAVVTTHPAAALDELMELMTARRIRHIPVVAGERLVGIVSIGDVVKRKIEETEQEASALKDYIAS